MKYSWFLWLLLSTFVLFSGCAFSPSSAAPSVQTPAPVIKSLPVPYPPPQTPLPTAFPTLLQQPTRRPPITYVIPTPPTPVSTAARIPREQAIAIATQNNPTFTSLQARGQLTVTATLTTWGEFEQNPRSPIAHPALPVWVVRFETTPWTEWRGPVGNQVQLTYRGVGYVIDAVTSNSLTGFSIFDDGAKK